MKKDLLVYAIDDSKFQLDILKSGVKKFKDEDYTISLSVFSTFLDLQIAMSEKVPDCCIVDLIMPYHPGTEVCHDVREKYPNIKVFINTYECGEEYKILAHACDATYMSKTTPFDERLEVILNACKS